MEKIQKMGNSQGFEKMQHMRLWYRRPANHWKEALPLGNGRLGAMVFGGIDIERLQLNEDSIYVGGPMDRRNPDCLPNLKKLQSLIIDGKLREAERLAVAAMSGMPESMRPYVPFGSIYLKFIYDGNNNVSLTPQTYQHTINQTEVTNYERSLDLHDAISKVSYKIGDTEFKREILISYPDRVLAIRLRAQGDQKLNFSCMMDRFHYHTKSWKDSQDTIAFCGDTGDGGVHYCGMLRGILNSAGASGRCYVIGEHLIIEEAQDVTLLFSGTTDFYDNTPEDECRTRLNAAAKLGWSKLILRHLADYHKLFERLTLTVGDCSSTDPAYLTLPTDERLQRVIDGGDDPELSLLHFYYGRYLLISSSRPGSQPANLQGIWNDTYHMSLCDSRHTININTQMNYWGSEMSNLPECHEPLFDLLERMHENGTVTARKQYGCNGFVAHHNTDLYADTDVQDRCLTSSYWLMGGAWTALHLWNHFLYSQDMDFLKKYFYIIRDSVRFFNDFLILNKDGWYVVVPTLSPENSYINHDGVSGSLCAGCAMDNAILTELYDVYMQGCERLNLGDDDGVLNRAKDIRQHICPPRISKYGTIMEWMEDYDEVSPGHRHFSPLYSVFPGEQLTMETSPELMKAARALIERRLSNGSGYTGWSRAWIINLWARLYEPEKVYENLQGLLRQSTFPNLMDNHPFFGEDGAAFQIDGNLGIISGLLQCFVQDDHSQVRLLHAVPKAYASGSLSGMRLKGGAHIDLSWTKGKLLSCCITADYPYQAEVIFDQNTEQIKLKSGEQWTYPTDSVQ